MPATVSDSPAATLVFGGDDGLFGSKVGKLGIVGPPGTGTMVWPGVGGAVVKEIPSVACLTVKITTPAMPTNIANTIPAIRNHTHRKLADAGWPVAMGYGVPWGEDVPYAGG